MRFVKDDIVSFSLKYRPGHMIHNLNFIEYEVNFALAQLNIFLAKFSHYISIRDVLVCQFYSPSASFLFSTLIYWRM